MLSDGESAEIRYLADKVHVHHWPLETPKWTDARTKKVDQEINKNKVKKQILVKEKAIKINDYEFNSIKNVGITIPFFKKQSTMIFEGRCEEFDAHVHITTKEKDYLEIFNELMAWKDKFFPDGQL